MNAVDTNILIYVLDPRDTRKQTIASELVEGLSDQVILWQVLCEYVAASRKLAKYGFSQPEAFENIIKLTSLIPVSYPTVSNLLLSRDLMQNYSLSFWDSMIVAGCMNAGVTTLYSEDFDAYPTVGTVRLVNPFRI
jgi:predicted nucleic acid-binding protein